MKKIELIKAEIERLKGQLIRGACASMIEMETNCKDEAYNEVLQFINSLPEDKPSEDLDAEINRYLREVDKEFDDDPSPYEIARHAAQWQKEQMMKDAVETIMMEGSLDNPTFVRRKIIVVKEDEK